MRRNWQAGRVYQEGRKKSDPWLPTMVAYVQYWRDVPGQAEPKRGFVSLGVCRTRTIAERKAAEKLEELGINSTQTFRESTSNITFKEQGEIWLQSLSNRKRNPLEQTTIDTRRYALDKWMYPFFGEWYLADVTNLAMKEFVDHISSLAPATIRDYVNIVKAVVASARDVRGEPLFMRDWDDEFIDIPEVDEQNQPTVDRDEMTAILQEAEEPYCTLYALLAGCGPMRAGKAQDHMKTKNADSRHGRVVDLSEPLAAILRDFVGGRTGGLVFCKPDGSQLMQRDILKHSLHPILKKLGLEQGGFNIFRRFRITELETAEVPAALQHTWSGHAKSHVSEVYKKLLKRREWRLRWTEKAGTGFTLPGHQEAAAEVPNGKSGKILEFRKVG